MPEQTRRPSPTTRPATAPTSGGDAYMDTQPQGNQAQQDKLSRVQGPMGRVFNRILGLGDNAGESAGMAFDRDQLQAYLDKNLQLAEGEFFRGKKLSGVADALMAQIDKDKSGDVTWPEFQVFQASVLQTIAPGAKAGAPAADVDTAADKQFATLDTGRKDKGQLTYDELNEGTNKALPKDTDHKDLVAQLGARLALDAADTDQRSQKVQDRTISGKEWRTAAEGMAGSK